jgi:hypothetical protein
MTQRAHTLAKYYEVGKTEEDFYNYIVDSLVNGQPQQVKELFNEMHKDAKQDFLINFLKPSIGYHKTTLNICIVELTN